MPTLGHTFSMSVRPTLALTCALAFVGCKESSAPAPEAPPPSPAAPSAAKAEAGYRLPKSPGVTCEYRLKDILTETLGDQLAAGHQVDVRFTLTTALTETGTLTYTLAVQHVHLEGKREAYSVKLDSNDHGQMVRVRGGADTLLLFDAVLYFALLGQTVVFEVDEAGRLTEVRGGDAVRQAYLAMHPPKPREAPHQRARVYVALSDEALARRFLPGAALVPEQGPLSPRTVPPAKGPRDFAEYAADMMRAARVRWVGEDLVIEEKRAFGPTDRKSAFPGPTGYPKVGLLSGQDQSTVALAADSPCYRRAATKFEFRQTWQGVLQEDEITTEQRREGTWLVQPEGEAPVVPARPASRPKPGPASQPAHP